MTRFKFEIYALSIATIAALLSLFLTSNYYLTLGIFLIYLLILFFCVSPLYKKRENKNRKRQEAYQFVHRFSITLSSTKSVNDAFSRGVDGNENRLFKSIIERTSDLSILERVRYLDDYFSTSFYSVFVSLFSLYEEEGGDFLKVADPLLKEMSLEMENANALHQESTKKLFEFFSLWGLSCFILTFIRIGLRSLFPYMIRSNAFLIVAASYFLVLLVSIIFFSLIYTGEKISFFRRKKV